MTTFELPKNIERYLAALSKLYGAEGDRQLQEIIVNARTRVHEGWSYDNLNGGTYGHALFLLLPDPLFLNSVARKSEIQNQIKNKLNKLHNVQNEFIDEVFLEMEVAEASDWRKESGLLLPGKRVVAPDIAERIWGDEGFRVFLSHKTEVKKQTVELKERLRAFGIFAFVAHEDIYPTREWLDEIQNALISMDAFVALLTPDFHDSDWTDHEVGFAFARGTPIIAVRLGRDPYGFLAKFQGLSGVWSSAANDIVKILIPYERMFGAYINALRKCRGWDTANTQATVLPLLHMLSEGQIDQLLAAYNENKELHGSFGFNGSRPSLYGAGLVSHLNRLSSRKFRSTPSGGIETV